MNADTNQYDGSEPDSLPMLDRAMARAARLDRQTRVGNLPNPNRAVVPPAHRPPLIGRWMKLRSTRRPKLAGVADPNTENPAPPDATSDVLSGPETFVEQDIDGISGIDIDRLMATVADLGTKSSQRVPVAADILGGHAVSPPPPVSDAAPKPPLQSEGAATASPELPPALERAQPGLLAALIRLWRGRLAQDGGRNGG